MARSKKSNERNPHNLSKVAVTLHEQHALTLAAAAKEAGVPMSEYARQAVLARLGKDYKLDEVEAIKQGRPAKVAA